MDQLPGVFRDAGKLAFMESPAECFSLSVGVSVTSNPDRH